jgi:preprotein translocase subunit YajC
MRFAAGGLALVTQYLLGMAQQAPGAGGALTQFVPLLLIFGVFWFLVIRPQSKKAKVHSQMLAELKKGDDVVAGVKDGELTLQVQEGVRLRVTRASITGRYPGAEAPKTDAKAS